MRITPEEAMSRAEAHFAAAERSLTYGGMPEGIAAKAQLAQAYIAYAQAERSEWSPPRADVVSSEPTHADHQRFVFRCGCMLTVPNGRLDPNERDVHVFCPIHDPNTRVPRELIDHWNNQRRMDEEPF